MSIPTTTLDVPAYRLGQRLERQRVIAILRMRAETLCAMPGPTPGRAVTELLRLAEQLELQQDG